MLESCLFLALYPALAGPYAPRKIQDSRKILNTMDLNEIKNLIEIDGGKFIIIENGKAEIVIMSFDEYKKRLTPSVALAKEGREKKPIPKELESEELRL